MNRKNVALLTAGVLLALAGTAQAATKNSSFQVSANVVSNCIINANALNFGNFDGATDITNVESTITVRCSNGTNFSVALNAGQTGSFTGRRMVNSSSSSGLPLVYNLYTTEARNVVWGDDSGVTDVVGGVGAGMAAINAQTLRVYGLLLASDNTGAIDAGLYTDTVTATVTY
jgi:spore coat protein U-like protein